jgi:hypothetical protein
VSKKEVLRAVLIGLTLAGAVAAPASGTVATAPVRGCAILGASGAAKFLGGPAQITHETNSKGPAPFVLNRGCTYSSGDAVLGYTVNTYASAGMAKTIFAEMAARSRESTANLFVMGANNLKVAGQPGYGRIYRLVPDEGEDPPAREFLYVFVFRKGATILHEEYTANDLDSGPGMIAAAKSMLPRI